MSAVVLLPIAKNSRVFGRNGRLPAISSSSVICVPHNGEVAVSMTLPATCCLPQAQLELPSLLSILIGRLRLEVRLFGAEMQHDYHKFPLSAIDGLQSVVAIKWMS